MAAHPVLFSVLAFGLGIVLQALLMLQGRFLPGDWRRAGFVLGIGLVGMFPARHEHGYSPLTHLLYSFTIAAAVFALFFRGRLLPRVGARLLLAWNILLVFVVLRVGGVALAVLILIAVPTLFTLLNAFTDLDHELGWQVFFHAWFSTILVVIALVGLDPRGLGMFFDNPGEVAARPPAEMVVTGAAWLYIITNAWFVVALYPFPIYRGQLWAERRSQVLRHMKLLAYGYVWEKHEPVRSLAVLLGLPLVLLASVRWGEGTLRAIVPLAIALMPLLGGGAVPATDDGVGELPAEEDDPLPERYSARRRHPRATP